MSELIMTVIRDKVTMNVSEKKKKKCNIYLASEMKGCGNGLKKEDISKST